MAHLAPRTDGKFYTELQADVFFAEKAYTVDFSELNVSGVDGVGVLTVRGDQLTTFIGATGLEANQLHVQHIHGFSDDTRVSRSPTIAFDQSELGGDEDGFIEVGEGAGAYGGILLSLTPFTTAMNGTIDFATTYNLPTTSGGNTVTLADLEPFEIRELVLHGRSVPEGVGAGTGGEVDGSGGYTPALPVASGEVRAASREQAQDVLARADIGSATFKMDGEGGAELKQVGDAAGIVNGFDSMYYLAANPDVAAAGVDGRTHYDTFGFEEGRDPNAYFDTSAYLEAYTDVAAAGVNPLTHYFQFGASEGRDPSVAFDTAAYLKAYTDVADAGVNPLEHFLTFGIYEGRESFDDGDFAMS